MAVLAFEPEAGQGRLGFDWLVALNLNVYVAKLAKYDEKYFDDFLLLIVHENFGDFFEILNDFEVQLWKLIAASLLERANRIVIAFTLKILQENINNILKDKQQRTVMSKRNF